MFKERVYIEDVGKHVGKEVTLKGWVYNTRSGGKIKFLLLRDGTGLIQCILFKGETDEKNDNKYDGCTPASTLTSCSIRTRRDSRR